VPEEEARRDQQSAPVTNQKEKPKRKRFLCNFFTASDAASDMHRAEFNIISLI